MKFYFGQEHDTETFGTSGLLKHGNEYYSGVIEFGSNPGGIDDVMISDGCGRSIPVSVEHLYAICTALSEVSNMRGEIDTADQLRDFVENKNEVATVCAQGHIHY